MPLQIAHSAARTGRDAWRVCAKDRELARALAFFRKTFGQAWAGWAEAHPLATQFFTAHQAGNREGVRLAQMAQALRACGDITEPLLRSLGGVSLARLLCGDHDTGVLLTLRCRRSAGKAREARSSQAR